MGFDRVRVRQTMGLWKCYRIFPKCGDRVHTNCPWMEVIGVGREAQPSRIALVSDTVSVIGLTRARPGIQVKRCETKASNRSCRSRSRAEAGRVSDAITSGRRLAAAARSQRAGKSEKAKCSTRGAEREARRIWSSCAWWNAFGSTHRFIVPGPSTNQFPFHPGILSPRLCSLGMSQHPDYPETIEMEARRAKSLIRSSQEQHA
jgi:hypothetical protein